MYDKKASRKSGIPNLVEYSGRDVELIQRLVGTEGDRRERHLGRVVTQAVDLDDERVVLELHEGERAVVKAERDEERGEDGPEEGFGTRPRREGVGQAVEPRLGEEGARVVLDERGHDSY